MRRILLRSGWQTVNIGDVAHWAGMLRLLERGIPDARVTLWPMSPLGAAERIARRSSVLEDIVLAPSDDQLARYDLLLLGSGGDLDLHAVRRYLRGGGSRWAAFGVTYTGGPYGTTHPEALPAPIADLLSSAILIGCRDRGTCELLERSGVPAAITGFLPDAAFGFDWTDPETCDRLLARFERHPPDPLLAIVPKLRHDPYWRMNVTSQSLDEIEQSESLNRAWVHHDHTPLVALADWWVEQAGGGIILCPEMTYELDLMGPAVLNRLAPGTRERTVCVPYFWLPDAAFSTYRRAAFVASIELHSPILAAAAGTQAVYLRQSHDSPKGTMWHDMGFPGWSVDLDSADADSLLGLAERSVSRASETDTEIRDLQRFVSASQSSALRTLDQAF